MRTPQFTIIIPTRERARYLDSALRTCLAQRADDFEILVADNNSSPATRETVDRFNDRRIRYVRSDEPLAMSENWERALHEARGHYVTIIGDDDGLLLHTLSNAAVIIDATSSPAIRWSSVFYRWPDVAPSNSPNSLSVPIRDGASWKDSRHTIAGVIEGSLHYLELPTLYNSFVRRSLLDEMRARHGRVFASSIPDIYSGLAIAAEIPRFVSVQRPMGIAGVSARSTGESVMRSRKDAPVALEFADLNAKFGYSWHPRAPCVTRSLPAMVAECFEHCRDRYPAMRQLRNNRPALATRILMDVSSNADSDAVAQAREALEVWLDGDARTRAWLEVQLKAMTARGSNRGTTRSRRYGIRAGRLRLDASEFAVTDTMDVATLVEKLLHATERPPDVSSLGWRDRLWSLAPTSFIEHARSLKARLR